MFWQKLGIIFNVLIHCPFFIWFCIALIIINIFKVEDPKFKKKKVL